MVFEEDEESVEIGEEKSAEGVDRAGGMSTLPDCPEAGAIVAPVRYLRSVSAACSRLAGREGGSERLFDKSSMQCRELCCPFVFP